MIRDKIRFPKRVRRRVSGVLLLALPFCALSVTPVPAQAQVQPATQSVATSRSAPRMYGEAKAIERIAAIARYQELCKSQLALNLENGTIADAIARIKAAFPTQQIEIRQRDVRPLKISLDLKATTVGAALSGLAALSDSMLWVMPSGLLLAAPDKLTEAERELVERKYGGSWEQSSANSLNVGEGWDATTSWESQQRIETIFANIIATEAKRLNPNGPLKTTYGQLGKGSQRALQILVTFVNMDLTAGDSKKLPLILSADSPVGVDFKEPKWISIDLTPANSSPQTREIVMDIRLPEPR